MKIGMVFPGYGSQFVGMGKELYDDSRVMQEYFEEAANCLNINFVKLCFAASDAELARMENAYTALFLTSCSIAALLKNEEGIEPHIVAGYNIGEFSALHATSGISFPDGLYLLSKLTSFYQEVLHAVPVAGMQVFGLPADELQKICVGASTDNELASIAIYDSPAQHTVMGTAKAIEKARELMQTMPDVDIQEAPTELGLHNSLMDPVVLNFKLYLEKVDFKELAYPLITNADAKLIGQSDLAKAAVIKQLHTPVLWHQTIDMLSPYDLIIEAGPGDYLTAMIKARYPEKKCIAINKRSDIKELKTMLEQHSSTTEI